MIVLALGMSMPFSTMAVATTSNFIDEVHDQPPSFGRHLAVPHAHAGLGHAGDKPQVIRSRRGCDEADLSAAREFRFTASRMISEDVRFGDDRLPVAMASR